MKQLFIDVAVKKSNKVSVDKLNEVRKPNIEKNNFKNLIKTATNNVQSSFNK